MNLPNYFFADLPPEATPTAAMITEACQTLKRNRAQYLAPRSTRNMIEILSELAENWRQPNYPFRKMVLELGPETVGFSAATLFKGLDAFFEQLTPENFKALLLQELGHAQRLDALVASSTEERNSRSAIARGPELVAHLTAGNLPVPALMSMVLSLLTRSAQFIKCASGTSFLPRLFAHSLYDAEPKLGACLEIAEWRGGTATLEEALFAETECVTATGTDETLTALRTRVPSHVRFLGYGHRVSFGYVTGDSLSNYNAKRIVARAVTDVVAWNQLGCLSPHVIYVEQSGAVRPEQFAEMLADELARRESSEPRGELPTQQAATIASRRAFYEVRAAHSPDTRFWCSENSTAWTVVYEADPRFQLSCLNRFIYVKAVPDLKTALDNADSVCGQVSTVGLAAPEERVRDITLQLARWGATRVCPIGQMQTPPLTWRHDGRPALGDLILWTDWEME